MIFGWESEREKVLRASKIPPFKKLEAIRLMNELTDKVLSPEQKRIRRKLRESD